MLRPIVFATALLATPALAPVALAMSDHHGGGASVEGQVGTQYMVFETSTESAEAREQFLEGLALLHNFEYRRARTSFEAAQRADPDFVMAYWGEAMTRNHPLWERQYRDEALTALGKLGATPQERRAKARNEREAAWLDAIETLFGAGTKHERDFLYLDKMQALLDADPSDIDARAFTGLAILGTSHGGRQIPVYMRAAGVLEPGFMTHEMHPGILHYLIHSYDDPDHAPLGERAAERYAKVAPDAGHAQHMVSHIYHALGDWAASETANTLADAVVDRQRAASGRDPTYCGHYNEWLVYARLQQGKDASDLVTGCRAQAENAIADGSDRRLGWGAASSYAVIATWKGVDGGVWPEPLDVSGDGFIMARIMMAHGRALETFGQETEVAKALADLNQLGGELKEVLADEAPDDRTTMNWVDRMIAQAEAILVLSEGQVDQGLEMLAAAAQAEMDLPTEFGPPRLAKPSFELLGEQLLALGRTEEAAQAFEKSLEFAPKRRLSLEGLKAAQGG